MSGRLLLIGERELAGALRARWFLAYSAVFLLGGVALAGFSLGDVSILGYRGFARAFAGLVHLALLFVPLMALVPGVAAVADERESGALEYLLAQPVGFGEVYGGKWLGVMAAVVLSLTVGLGTAGAVAVMRGVPPGLLLVLYVEVILLAAAFVSVGICLATLTPSRQRALTLGLVLWLAFVALGTLGLMAAFVRWGVPRQVLLVWSFVNPVEAFRLGVVASLDPDLSLLGPAGAVLMERLGPRGTVATALASLLVWTAVPALLGWWRFRTRG